MTVHIRNESEAVGGALEAAAGRHFGTPVAIEGLSRESGGASRQTWSFDAIVQGQRHELILRRDPPSLVGKGERERSAALDRATEFRVLRAAYAAGVRAPEVLFELGPQDGLGEGFMRRSL